MVPSPSSARPPLARRLLPPALLVFSALVLMLAVAASAMAGVPPAAPRGDAVPVGTSATPIPTPQCTRAWELEDVPAGQTSGRLLAIDDVAPNDIWAVGVSNNDPRIEHFDGTNWTVITPTIVFTRGLLSDVSAVSANDVWAVGENADPGVSRTGLLLHYTGTQWAKVTYPNPATGDVLHSVDAVSSNEVWAVGTNVVSATPLVLRWNGTAWSRATAPPAGWLQAVAAVDTITATQLWAVGYANPGPNQYPIITHYDGAQWTTTPVAVTGALYNVAALSPTDIWAVGTSAEPTLRTLVMHYDGNMWTRSPAPFVGELRGIHALSANDVWATGAYNYYQDDYGPTRVLHWDGAAWYPVQSPVLTPGGGTFFDVRATTSDDLWAVGINRETWSPVQLIARYASICPEPLACQTGWNIVDTIDINPEWNALLAIDASAPNDVWAVGLAGGQGVAKHWNGSYWHATSIGATPEGTSLWGVSAISPNNVWAVGYKYEGSGARVPLDPRERRAVPLWNTSTVTVHWDGTTWTRVPSPNPTPGLENILWGVDGVGPNDVWAVGETHGQGLILHWDGSAWTQYPLPTGVTAGYLRDVEAVSTNDVWVAGSTSDSVPSRSVILHWDGKEWSQTPSPNPGIDPNGRNILESIDAISANDIWAVGVYEGSAGSGSLTLHWDGIAWTHVPAPSIGWLTGVSGSSNNDVWVVATPITTTLSGLHWNGSQWATVDLPEPKGEPLWLLSVVAPSQNEVWAAGYSGPISDSSSLIERYVGSCQTATPTPDLTPPTVTTPTITPTPLPDGCMWVWDIMMDSPTPEGRGAGLYGIEALSPTDVWAVGAAGHPAYGMLIKHWDGSGWTVMPPPSVITTGALYDVTATSPEDVWAVGSRDGAVTPLPVAFHWDGTQWTDVPLPTEPDWILELHAVDALSENDVWAVGTARTYSPFLMKALVFHWNGSVWTRIATPQIATYEELWGVSAAAEGDIWAVGTQGMSSFSEETLVLRWRNNQWEEVPTPAGNRLYDVEALASNEVWVVGDSLASPRHGVILRWDGTQWNEYPPMYDAVLKGIEARGPDDIWTVGVIVPLPNPESTLMMHWDGNQWSRVPGFRPWGGSHAELLDVSVISPNEVWVAGEVTISGGVNARPLAARYSLRCPEPVACQYGWNIVPTLDPDPTYNFLYAADASAPDNVWAVGETFGHGALIKRWDGETWQIMPPAPVTSSTALYGVKVFSPNEAWAVGSEGVRPLQPGTRPRKAEDVPEATSVILRWDGTQWHRLASSGWGTLLDIDGVAPNDLWAVGYSGSDTFTLHWNGAQWTQRPAGPGFLGSVKTITPDNAWAVGYIGNETLTLHLENNQWVRRPSPNPGTTYNRLNAVDATGSSDVWAVGLANGGTGGALVLHWNGSQWTELLTSGGELYDVSALAANDVWAVQTGTSPTNAAQALRWNGTQWTVHSLPSPPTQPWGLERLVAMSSNEVWAVGGQYSLAYTVRSLIERYVGTCQTVTPTSIMTATPTGTRTSTSTPASSSTNTTTRTRTPTPTYSATLPPGITATPSPTPTACALAFADVPPTNTFYPFVRCLACQGIIQGYPCGGAGEPCDPGNNPYFRPNAYVTRGQLAKIVSESAGFDEEVPPSQWTFTDVPYGSTFWEWVERLANREVMAGYVCGGAGEPCDSQNRPYFRPGNGATRGQLTKIVSNAAGFDDTIPPTQYTFTDVPPTHTFWMFVERLLLNRPDVMAGYACGGAGEPCDTQNRPYFRPNNPLTRGQTSKIVANTFFPDCNPPRR